MGKTKRERQKYHIAATAADVEMDEKPVPTVVKVPAVPLATTENIFAGIDIKLDTINKFTESAVAPPVESTAEKLVKSGPYKKNKVDAVPTVVVKKPPTQPERQLTKKEKQRLKHEKLLQKIDVIQQAKQKTQDKRKKQVNSLAPIPNVPSAASELKTLSKKVNETTTANNNQTAPKKKFSTSMKTLADALSSLNDSLPSLDSVIKLRSKDAKTGLDEDVVDGGSGKNKKNKKGKKFANGKVKGHQNKPNKSKELINQFNHYQKLIADDTFKKNPRAVIGLHIKNKLRNRR